MRNGNRKSSVNVGVKKEKLNGDGRMAAHTTSAAIPRKVAVTRNLVSLFLISAIFSVRLISFKPPADRGRRPSAVSAPQGNSPGTV
jgi:hypothetical protein